MTCSDRIATAHGEYACRLTGVSVDEHCRPGNDDCIPRKALLYRMGLLPLERIQRDEREAVVATAQRLKGEPAMEISTLPANELKALRKRIDEETRRRAEAEKVIPRLEREQERVAQLTAWAEKRADTLDRAIADLRAGKVRDVAAFLSALWHDRRPPIIRIGQSNRRRFRDDTVREIRRRAAAGETNGSIGRDLGVPISTIQAVVTRRTYPDVPDEA